MRSRLYFIFFLFFTSSLFAQNSRIDSLKQVLDHVDSDIQKAKICSRISRMSLPSDYSQGLSYAYLSLTFAQRTKDPLLIEDAFIRIANVYSFLEVPEIAIIYYRRALKYLDNDTSVNQKSKLYGFIGQTYLALKQYDSSQIHFKLARSYGLQGNNRTWHALLNVFNGDLCRETGQSDSAIYFYKMARDTFQVLQHRDLIHECNLKLVNLYMEEGNRIQTLDFLHQAEITEAEDSSSIFYCQVEQALAGYFITYKNAGRALTYLQKADHCLDRMNHPYPLYQKEQQRLYADYYTLTGNTEKAFFARRNYIILTDTLYTRKLRIIDRLMNLRYQTESKTGEINLLEKEYQYQLIKNTKNNNLRRIGFITIFVLFLSIVLIIVSIILKNRSAKQLNRHKAELQRLYDQLYVKEEASLHEKQIRDKLLSVITQNLINPFDNLLGFTSLLSEEIQHYKREEIIKYAGLIHDSSKNLHFLLENLLQWSRLQTGRIGFRPGYFEVKNVVNRINTTFQLLLDKKKITFIMNLPDESIAFGDELLIEVVLKNLIHNAIKYSFNGSTIEVSGIRTDADLIIHVKDEGTGIDRDHKRKLFGLDQHFSKEGTEGEEGTGLGLILAKEMLKMHDRELTFHTKTGKGSTFTFSLPLTRQNTLDYDNEKPNL